MNSVSGTGHAQHNRLQSLSAAAQAATADEDAPVRNGAGRLDPRIGPIAARLSRALPRVHAAPAGLVVSYLGPRDRATVSTLTSRPAHDPVSPDAVWWHYGVHQSERPMGEYDTVRGWANARPLDFAAKVSIERRRADFVRGLLFSLGVPEDEFWANAVLQERLQLPRTAHEGKQDPHDLALVAAGKPGGSHPLVAEDLARALQEGHGVSYPVHLRDNNWIVRLRNHSLVWARPVAAGQSFRLELHCARTETLAAFERIDEIEALAIGFVLRTEHGVLKLVGPSHQHDVSRPDIPVTGILGAAGNAVLAVRPGGQLALFTFWGFEELRVDGLDFGTEMVSHAVLRQRSRSRPDRPGLDTWILHRDEGLLKLTKNEPDEPAEFTVPGPPAPAVLTVLARDDSCAMVCQQGSGPPYLSLQTEGLTWTLRRNETPTDLQMRDEGFAIRFQDRGFIEATFAKRHGRPIRLRQDPPAVVQRPASAAHAEAAQEGVQGSVSVATSAAELAAARAASALVRQRSGAAPAGGLLSRLARAVRHGFQPSVSRLAELASAHRVVLKKRPELGSLTPHGFTQNARGVFVIVCSARFALPPGFVSIRPGENVYELPAVDLAIPQF